MTNSRAAWTVAGLAAAVLCLAARADEAGMARVLSFVPPDAELILAAPDASQLTAKTQDLFEAMWRSGGREAPADDAARLTADAKELASGAATLWLAKDGWVAAIKTQGDRSSIAGRFKSYGTFTESGDLWILRLPRARSPLYGMWRSGVLLLSNNAARLRVTATGTSAGNTAFANWMKSPDALAADLVLYQTRGALWRTILDLPVGPLWRHFNAALNVDLLMAQPFFANLRLRDRDFRADLFADLPPAPVPVPAPAALPIQRSLGSFELAVTGFPPADIVDFIAAAEDRFDPDAGKEFQEDLASLNRDLGFDLTKDLLGRLGSWALAITPSEDGRPLWSFAARLDSAEKFIPRAQRLAEFAEAGWAEGPEFEDAQRFTTSAFTAPVSLAVRPGWLVAASSPDTAEPRIRWTQLPPPADAPAALWSLETRLDLSALGLLATQCLPLRRAPAWLGGFPPTSVLALSARRTERRLTMTVSLTNVSLQQLIVLATPLPEKALPPKWVLEQPMEKIDIKTRELAVRKLGEWAALGPNKDGLYRNPRTGEFTMTTPTVCVACGKKVPVPMMPLDLINKGPDAHAAWLNAARCPLCGKAMFPAQ